jgi:hypothetical protein
MKRKPKQKPAKCIRCQIKDALLKRLIRAFHMLGDVSTKWGCDDPELRELETLVELEDNQNVLFEHGGPYKRKRQRAKRLREIKQLLSGANG